MKSVVSVDETRTNLVINPNQRIDMNITENQKKLLIAFSEDTHVADLGWEHEDAGAWNDCLADEMVAEGIKRESVGGVIAKASEAGLILTCGGSDGATSLTDLGRQTLSKLLNNQNKG